jgi:dTDP-4-amino-4,6-dideoxygalactose transaminase
MLLRDKKVVGGFGMRFRAPLQFYKGKSGTFGTIASLSFNGNKIITTSCGGAIVTKLKN